MIGGGQFNGVRNHVVELCIDGVQAYDGKQHSIMLPIGIRIVAVTTRRLTRKRTNGLPRRLGASESCTVRGTGRGKTAEGRGLAGD